MVGQFFERRIRMKDRIYNVVLIFFALVTGAGGIYFLMDIHHRTPGLAAMGFIFLMFTALFHQKKRHE